MKSKEIIKIVIGLLLIVFAVVPTPDDVTIISPVLAFTTGVGLINSALDFKQK